MATVPRRLRFGAHAGAYERARPEWPEEAARWLVPEGAELVVELRAGTGKLTRAGAALGRADGACRRARRRGRRGRAGSADAGGAARARARRGGGGGRGDPVRRRGGGWGRRRLEPALVRARGGAAGDPSRVASGRPLRLRLEPSLRPASRDRGPERGGLRGAGA